MKSLLLALVGGGLVTQPGLALDVLVLDVQPGPGVDFTNFEQAVAQAGPGDILLIRPGNYVLPFQSNTVNVSVPDLTIVGELFPAIPDIGFTGLGPGRFNVLRGVQLGTTGSPLDASVSADQNQGTLWIEDAGLLPIPSPSNQVASTRFDGCDSVVLQRCRLRGRSAFLSVSNPGITAADTAVWAHDSTVDGGGGFFGASTILPASPGVLLSDSSAFLSGTEVSAGSDGVTAPPDDAVQSGNSVSQLVESPADWQIQGGTQEILTDVARSFRARPLSREGESVVFTFGAPANELAILALASQPLAQFVPLFAGPGLLANPITSLLVAGTLPASGELQTGLPVPFFPAGFEGATLFAQAAYVDPATGSVRLGGGSAFVVLDGSF